MPSRRGTDALGGARPDVVLAVGESQSAFALTTYADVVQPLTRAFDGFLLHSRGSNPLPLDSPSGTPADIASSLALPPAIIRTDLGVPTLILETETDLTSILGYVRARQDDTADLRLWEVAGTAHADRSMLGTTVDQIDCGVAVNDGPQRFVVRPPSGRSTSGCAPGRRRRRPRASRSPPRRRPEIVRDADGIAVGGIRLPPVGGAGRHPVGREGTGAIDHLPPARLDDAVRGGPPGRSGTRRRRPTSTPTPPRPTRRSPPGSPWRTTASSSSAAPIPTGIPG